jgi:AraC-like DNA-binding protein
MGAIDQAAGAKTPAIVRISSEGIDPRHRTQFITDDICLRLTGSQASALESVVPEFSYAIADLGGVQLGQAELAGVDFDRQSHHIRDGDSDYSVFAAFGQDLQFEQNGLRFVLRKGDCSLVTLARPLHTRVASGSFLILKLPRSAFRGPLRDRHPAAAPLLASPKQSYLLRSYMRAAMRLANSGTHVPLAARHLSELSEALFCTLDRPSGPARQAARLAAMQDIMLQRYHEPTLSMRGVASAVGMSERAGYMVFESVDKSFSDELLAIRLERAMEMLHGSGGRVLDIAMAVGFSDMSNFNRRFRERFGVSPTEARRAVPHRI